METTTQPLPPTVAPTLGATFDPHDAFVLLGVSDWLGYKKIREGTFPVPVIRVGRKIRIPRAPLERLLGIDNTRAVEHNYFAERDSATGTVRPSCECGWSGPQLANVRQAVAIAAEHAAQAGAFGGAPSVRCLR